MTEILLPIYAEGEYCANGASSCLLMSEPEFEDLESTNDDEDHAPHCRGFDAVLHWDVKSQRALRCEACLLAETALDIGMPTEDRERLANRLSERAKANRPLQPGEGYKALDEARALLKK